MGRIKPEDHTALAASGFVMLTGLIAMAGGVSSIVLGTQSNDREDHSGDSTISSGVMVLAGGMATLAGGIVAVCMKLREVRARVDDDEEAPALPDAPAPDLGQAPPLPPLEDVHARIDNAVEGLEGVLNALQPETDVVQAAVANAQGSSNSS